MLELILVLSNDVTTTADFCLQESKDVWPYIGICCMWGSLLLLMEGLWDICIVKF